MHRKEQTKRRGKGKRKEEKYGDLIAKKKNQVRAHIFFRGDPCAVTFHEPNVELERRILGESLLYLLSFTA